LKYSKISQGKEKPMNSDGHCCKKCGEVCLPCLMKSFVPDGKTEKLYFCGVWCLREWNLSGGQKQTANPRPQLVVLSAVVA